MSTDRVCRRSRRTASRSASGRWAGRAWTCSAARSGRRCPPTGPCASSPSSAPTGSTSTTTTSSRSRPAARSGTGGSAAFRAALADTGLVVTTATTNLFGHPMFKEGAFTANDRDVRRFALAKVMRNLDLAAELGARVYVCWGGREGAESGAAKDVRAALDRYKEAFDILGQLRPRPGVRPAVRDRAQAQRAARRHPAAHGRARAGVHQRARAPGACRAQPGGRARGDGRAQLRARDRPGAVARQAVPHRPQRAERPALRPGPAVRRGQRAGRVLGGGPAGSSDYDGPVHFDYKPPRTEDDDGVWESAAACMRNYLILREKVARVPRRSRGQGGARRVAGARAGPAHPGHRGDVAGRARTSPRTSTRSPPAGMAFERLDQLALEHLYGVR